MTIKGLFAAAAGVAMMTTGTMAAAAPLTNPAASLSIAPRAGSNGAHGSQIGASVATTTLISIGVLAALVVIVLVAVPGSSSGSPKSP